jgi:hypothetical protein
VGIQQEKIAAALQAPSVERQRGQLIQHPLTARGRCDCDCSFGHDESISEERGDDAAYRIDVRGSTERREEGPKKNQKGQRRSSRDHLIDRPTPSS